VDVEIKDDRTVITIYDTIDSESEAMLLGWVIRYILESFLETWPERRAQMILLLDLIMKDKRYELEN
jgi:hypothetical protein